MRGIVSAQCLELLDALNAYGVHPAHYAGARLHGLRDLFLLLSRAGRDHGLSHDGAGKSAGGSERGANMRQLCKGNIASRERCDSGRVPLVLRLPDHSRE